MKCPPYIPLSVRSAKLYRELSEEFGYHEVLLRRAAIDCPGISQKDFFQAVRERTLKLSDFIPKGVSVAEINLAQRRFEEAASNKDLVDLSSFSRKEIIEVGDEIVATDDVTTLTDRVRILTKGKRYKVLTLQCLGDDKIAITHTTNLNGDQRHCSELSVWSLWRDGKEIWNWHSSYYSAYEKLYPNVSKGELEELKAFCLVEAATLRGDH